MITTDRNTDTGQAQNTLEFPRLGDHFHTVACGLGGTDGMTNGLPSCLIFCQEWQNRPLRTGHMDTRQQGTGQ